MWKKQRGGSTMKSWRIIFLGVWMLFCVFSTSFGSSINGGLGLNYVRSAWVLKPGYLTLTMNTRFFGKVSSPIQQVATTYWDVQGALSFNYGINDHFEVALAPIMYQDNHKGEEGYNFPDDIFLRVKIGSYNIKNKSITYGFVLQTRFPTGKHHNIVFEPYSAGTISWGFMGLATYSRDPLYPEDNFNVHFNVGYTNFNDVGKKLSINPEVDEVTVSTMTQELSYAVGFKIPTAEFDFSLELYGNSFIQKPPKETAYSCENFIYLTPGITFRAYKWLSLTFGTDLRLSSNTDETLYKYGGKIEGMPNYPSWRVNLGAKITLLPTEIYKIDEKDILIKKAKSRRELFEQIIKEQKETESAEEELERIKNERRKAERELERLRRILEGDTKSKKEKQDEK